MTPQSLHLVEPPPSDPRDHKVLSDAPLIVDDDASARRAQEARNRERDQAERERAIVRAEDFHRVCDLLTLYGEVTLRQFVDDAVLQHEAGRAAGAFSGDGL